MPKRKLQAEDLLTAKFVSEVIPHPRERLAACCVKTVRTAGKYQTQLSLVEEGKPPIELTSAGFSDGSPAWSADGSWVYFISNRDKPRSQVYRVGRGGGEPKKLTELPEGSLASFKLSKDSQRMVLKFRETSSERTSQAADARKEKEESDPPYIIERWPYREDGDGLFNADKHRLYLWEANSGKARCVFEDSDLGDIDFDLSPDGKTVALAFKPGLQTYMEPDHSELWLLDLESGNRRLVETPFGSLTTLTFDASGERLVCIYEDRTQHKWGPAPQSILVIELSSGKIRRYLESDELQLEAHAIGDFRDPVATRLFWAPDGKSLVFGLGKNGSQVPVRLSLDSGSLVDLSPGFRGEVHLGGVSADGKLGAAAVTTELGPAEPHFVDFEPASANLVPIHSFNAEWIKDLEISVPEEIEVVSPDGQKVQAWFLPPTSGTPKPHPAAIEVHGGPMAMYTCAFFFEMQLLAANGIGVFFSNPRGSTGYGNAFARAITGNWGEKDWMDVTALTDVAEKHPDVNPARISILGGSYGGFMVNWAIGHTNRYYRAVTDRCVSNLMSKWGSCDYMYIPDGIWPGSFFGDYERLLKCSPLRYFSNVKTPTLIVHSEGDLRCCIEQGEQVYAALKLHGIETRFIRYPASSSHGMSRNGPPDLRVHRLKSILEWLCR